MWKDGFCVACETTSVIVFEGQAADVEKNDNHLSNITLEQGLSLLVTNELEKNYNWKSICQNLKILLNSDSTVWVAKVSNTCSNCNSNNLTFHTQSSSSSPHCIDIPEKYPELTEAFERQTCIFNCKKKIIAMPLMFEANVVGVLCFTTEEARKHKGLKKGTKALALFLSFAMELDCRREREKKQQEETKRIVHESIQELQDVNNLRDSFIAALGHEIRTPATGIVAATEVMLGTDLPFANAATFKKMLNIIQTCCGQLLEIRNDLLDFCKLRTTRMKLDESPIDLYQTINEIVNVCSQQALNTGIELSANIECLRILKVFGDSTRLKQILLNVFNNALKHTNKNGFIFLETDVKELEDGIQWVSMKIRDTGEGILPENLKMIFEPYFTKKPKNWSNSLNGIGLGLSICRELVHLMGGDISAKSQIDVGTEIIINIPFRDSEYFRKSADELSGKSCLPKGSSVLVLDDRLEQRMYMMKLLTMWAMLPHAFSNSAEAIMSLEMMGTDRFRVALVDIDLSESSPHDTGVIFAQNVRAKNLSLKLIAVSSVGSHFSGDQLFDYVLTKPINEAQLFKTLQTCFSREYEARGGLKEKNVLNVLTEEEQQSEQQHHGIRRLSVSGRIVPHKKSGRISEKTNNKSVTILIVDDNEVNGDTVGEMLKLMGYDQVSVVNSSEKCLSKLRNYKENEKDNVIVFLDIIMPQVNGIQCASIVRSSPMIYGKPRLISFTADALDSTRFKCNEMGFDYHLCKPVTSKDLETAIHWAGRCT